MVAKFSREELKTYHGKKVPDLISKDLKLLFVGINPGLWTAATKTHFAHPTNRFWPAMYKAGVTSYLIDYKEGMSDDDRKYLLSIGIGITNVVEYATARADELTKEDYIEGGKKLEKKVKKFSPNIVAIQGITAYRQAFGNKDAIEGKSTDGIAGSELWVLPNPSGLNAHESVDSLAKKYKKLAKAAGILA